MDDGLLRGEELKTMKEVLSYVRERFQSPVIQSPIDGGCSFSLPYYNNCD